MTSSIFENCASFRGLVCVRASAPASAPEDSVCVEGCNSNHAPTHDDLEDPDTWELPDENDCLETSVPAFVVSSEKLRSITLNSRQATQNAVERILSRIMAVCIDSAMAEEDGKSINMDALITFVWPQAVFEGFEKDLFCKHRYKHVTTAQQRLTDTLDPAARERLVIILSLKERIGEELRNMGFSELHDGQVREGTQRSSSYKWQIRRLCDSGPDSASWLHLKWSVAEVGFPPTSGDESVGMEDQIVCPCARPPRGASVSCLAVAAAWSSAGATPATKMGKTRASAEPPTGGRWTSRRMATRGISFYGSSLSSNKDSERKVFFYA